MSNTAQDIMDRARLVLNDETGVRWLDAEFWKWIGDGQRVIALVRPDSTATNGLLTLSAGTRQDITASDPEALRLLDVIRNETDRAIKYIDRDVLDSVSPEWHKETGVKVIKHWLYDDRDPKHFYVYPPSDGTTKVYAIYSKNPTQPTANNSALAIDPIYFDPLLNYVLHRCYCKDAEFTYNLQLAGAYLQIFNGLLGIKTKVDLAFSPDLNSKGASPAPAAAVGGV